MSLLRFVLAVFLLPVLTMAQGLSLSCEDGRGGTITVSWLHPQPQGNAIGAVDFLDARNGWAVGDLGTVLRTTDGGEKWSMVATGTRDNLFSVSVASPSTVWVAGSGTIRSTHNDGRSWTTHRCPQRDAKRLGVPLVVEALSASTVVLLTNDAVWRSEDRGTTWSLRHDLYMARLMFFLDNRHGWAVGEHGRVLRTTDGGREWSEHWIVQRPGAPAVLCFSDTLNGICLDSPFNIHYTSDGGRNWRAAKVPLEFLAGTLRPGGDWLVVFPDGLGRSTNNGADWQDLLRTPLWDVGTIAFANADTAVMLGNHGVMLRSTDGGFSWSRNDNGPPRYLAALSFPTTDKGWAAGQEGIFHTMDAGAHWHRQYDPGRARIKDLCFLDERTGWAVDDHSHVLATTDGGVRWKRTKLDAPGHGILIAVTFPDARHGWIAAEKGTLYSTEDAGATWTEQLLPVTGDIARIDFTPTGAGICLTHTGEGAATTDGGVSWRGWSFGRDYQPAALARIDDTTIVVLATINRQKTVVLRSSDHGRSWITTTISESGMPGAAMHFEDRDHGLLVLADGSMLTSVDGGLTWQPLPTPLAFPVTDVAVPAPGRIFVAGHDGSILRVDWDSGEHQ